MKGHEIDPYDALAKGFEQNRVFTHMRPTESYGKWLEATWAFLDATGNPDAFRAYLDHYSYEEGREFARLVVVYTEAVEAWPFRDVLGELVARHTGNPMLKVTTCPINASCAARVCSNPPGSMQ